MHIMYFNQTHRLPSNDSCTPNFIYYFKPTEYSASMCMWYVTHWSMGLLGAPSLKISQEALPKLQKEVEETG